MTVQPRSVPPGVARGVVQLLRGGQQHPRPAAGQGQHGVGHRPLGVEGHHLDHVGPGALALAEGVVGAGPDVRGVDRVQAAAGIQLQGGRRGVGRLAGEQEEAGGAGPGDRRRLCIGAGDRRGPRVGAGVRRGLRVRARGPRVGGRRRSPGGGQAPPSGETDPPGVGGCGTGPGPGSRRRSRRRARTKATSAVRMVMVDPRVEVKGTDPPIT